MKYWTKDQIDRIASAIGENRFAVFFGSGISASSGLPDWDGLIEGLMSILKNPGVYDKGLISGIESYRKKSPLELLDYLRDTDREAFTDRFRKFFPQDKNKYKDTEEGQLIARFDTSRFVTINYDYCFQHSFTKVKPNSELKEFVGVYTKDSFDKVSSPTIYQIHGRAESKIEELVLTDSQYDRAYRAGASLPISLEHLFTEYLVLFVGFGFADADIKRILARSNVYSSMPGRYKHIGIFGHRGNKHEQDGLRDIARKRWHTEAVIYKITGPIKKQSHDRLKNLLVELHQSIGSWTIEKTPQSIYESDDASMATPPVLSK